ncbi:MAG: PAS domain S-box protein [Caldilineaceae bacterium]
MRYFAAQNVQSHFEKITQETTPVVVNLLELQVVAAHLQKDAVSYWLTYDLNSQFPLKVDDIFDKLLSKQTHFDESKAELDRVLAHYHQLTDAADPHRAAIAESAASLYESARDLIKYDVERADDETLLRLKTSLETAEADFLAVTAAALATEMSKLEAERELGTRILDRVNLAIIASIVLTIATILVLRSLVANKILQLFAELELAAQAIASGNFDTRLPVVSHDELGSLATTFNQMAARIKRSFDEIAEYTRKIQAANDLQSALFGSINHAILVLEGPERIMRLGNRAVERIFGYPIEDALGQPVSRLFRDVSLYNAMLDKYATALDQGATFHVGDVPHRLNGKRRYLDITVTPIFDGATYTGDVVVVQDVTQQHFQHQLLLESEAKYRELFNSMNEGFALHEMIYDTYGHAVDYRYLEVNPAFERLTGLHRADVEGRTAREVLPQVLQEVIDEYAKVVETGETLHKEDFVPDVGRYFRVTAFRARPGQFVSTFHDITDKVEASKKLERSEEMFRTMTETMPAPVIIMQGRKMVYSNPAAQRFMGDGDHPHSTPGDFIHPETWALWEGAFTMMLSGQEKQTRLVYQAHNHDGVAFWFDSSVATLNYQGQPSLLIMTIDVTEQVNAKAALEDERALLAQRVEERTVELRNANRELAQAIRHKDEFLASMSHELRTPLNAILGIAEIMGEEIYGPINEKQHKRLQDLEESGRHLLDLINDVLDVAKIDAGKLILEVADVEINSVCESSLRMIRQAAFKKQLRVDVAINTTATHIKADGRRLKQMLMNLLSNAVKFTPESGEIGLSVTQEADNEAIQFTVWDTGIGIAPEEQERLFQPFVQVDSSLSRAHEGTGLGLALVHKMAKLHGGTVSLESELGKGSRFTITFPLLPPPDHHTPARSAAPA